MSDTFGISGDDECEAYLHGQCHLLAVALHRLTGRSITAAIAYDCGIEQDALVHCWLDLDADEFLDASGITTTDYSLQSFPDGDEAATITISSMDLLALGEGMPVAEMNQMQLADLERRIALAGGYAKKLIAKVLQESLEDDEEPDRPHQLRAMLSGLDQAPKLSPRP